MTIKTDFDEVGVKQRILNDTKKKQSKLDAQVLKDSNYYCPLDTSMLQKSGILHTVIGSGRVIWQTPYAREQYYGKPNKSHQKNPNACMKWFEAAKSKCVKTWLRLVND